MPRALRVYLLGAIAVAFGYLAIHAREPLRLNLGDPEADAHVMTVVAAIERDGLRASTVPAYAYLERRPLVADAYPAHQVRSLAELGYGALARYLGVRDVGSLRLVALLLGALAMWALFHWARRMWGAPVGLIATALFTTSLWWLTTADSLHHAPITQASGFLALWAIACAIERRQRRHLVAAFVASWACYLSAYDYWLVLPAAALFTVHHLLGAPLARGHRRFLAVCVAGGVAGIATKALLGIGAPGWHAASALDGKLALSAATLVRRYALLLSPMLWVSVAVTLWRALRAPGLAAAARDGVTWLLAIAALSLYAAARPLASELLGCQAVMPFYAIGSALAIQRLLDGLDRHRALAYAWLGFAPLWAGYVAVSHRRAVLDRDDVAAVNAYLAAHDRNDFVVSNLLAEAPIEAAFARHAAPAVTSPDPRDRRGARDPDDAARKVLELLEAAGTDYAHAVIFTTPESRFTDRPLWALAAARQLWSVTGWPDLNVARARKLIRAYDKDVVNNLERAGAQRVLHLRSFDLYRLDRASLVEAVGRDLPVTRELHFHAFEAGRQQLLGWGDPWITDDGVGVVGIAGLATCAEPAAAPRAGEPAANPCRSVPTRTGLKQVDDRHVARAQLLIRVERACDLHIAVELSEPASLRASLGGVTSAPCEPARQVAFDLGRRAVRAGLNVLSFDQRFTATDSAAGFATLTIEPQCGAD